MVRGWAILALQAVRAPRLSADMAEVLRLAGNGTRRVSHPSDRSGSHSSVLE